MRHPRTIRCVFFAERRATGHKSDNGGGRQIERHSDDKTARVEYSVTFNAISPSKMWYGSKYKVNIEWNTIDANLIKSQNTKHEKEFRKVKGINIEFNDSSNCEAL